MGCCTRCGKRVELELHVLKPAEAVREHSQTSTSGVVEQFVVEISGG